MKKNLIFTLLLCLLYLTVAATPVQTEAQEIETPLGGETPAVLVEAGVSSFALVPPRIHWNTSPQCMDIPESPSTLYEDGPEAVSRIPTYGGPIRQLLFVDEIPYECTPYAILSNIIADEQYVYWTDDTGLVRLPIEANVGDPVEFVSDDILAASLYYPIELTDAGDDIYASVYNNGVYTLWRVAKSTMTTSQVLSRTGAIGNLSFDGDYVYWIDHTNNTDLLYRTEKTTTGYNHLFLGVQVTGYYAEGLWAFCQNGCVETHYVFIAHDNHVDRYNNQTNQLTQNIYVSDSTEPGTIVYEMVTDYNNLFILEQRPTDIFLQRDFLLLRTGRLGGNVDYLYANTGSLDYPPHNLRTDDQYLYWIKTYGAGAGETQLLSLPNDAEAMPLTNLYIGQMNVTQGIQTLDNEVGLIRGRRTFVQVYGLAESGVVEGVTAILYRLDSNGNITGTTYPINEQGKNLTLFTEDFLGLLSSNFLFEIPLAWTDTSTLRLRAVLNPSNRPLELDSDRADNIMEMTLSMLPSPRLEVDFYVLTYGVIEETSVGLSYQSYTPDMEKDVKQTISWITRTYPLASKPGDGDDPSPGFRPNIIEMDMGEALGERVTQIHGTCYLYFEPDERNLCASAYVNNFLKSIKYASQSNHIFYGLMSDEAAFPRGQGSAVGVASGPAGATSGWDLDERYTDRYAAHEIGHAIGRGHPLKGAESCKQKPGDWSYPYNKSLIGSSSHPTMGFDPGDPSFDIGYQIMPYLYWADFMSYCSFQWISDYTYMGIYQSLFLGQQAHPLAVAPVGADLLGVYGILLPDEGIADLQIVQKFDTGATIPALISGDYSIRLRNATGTLLADYPFTPEGDDILSFGQIVTWVAGTTTIQIVDLTNGTIMAETPVSANPPQISNVALANPPNPVAGNVTLTWTATDPDNDPLSFDIEYSRNGGVTFHPIQIGVTGNSTELDMDALGGGLSFFRVTASDGVHLTKASSPPYVVTPKPPNPHIITPGDGAVFQWGQTIHLMGTAYDLQDGMVDDANLIWRLGNTLTSLGTGPAVTLDIHALPVGTSEIRLIATNSTGQTASESIFITIHDELAFPGPTLEVGPTQLGWHVEPGTTALQTGELLVSNLGTGVLTWEATTDVPWLSLSAPSGAAPDSFTVTANPAGMSDGESRGTQVTVIGYDSENQVVGTFNIPVHLSAGGIWLDDEAGTTLYLPLVLKPE